MRKKKSPHLIKKINPNLSKGIKISKIIKFEEVFDPTKIPLNLRWEVRDFKTMMDMGEKTVKKKARFD